MTKKDWVAHLLSACYHQSSMWFWETNSFLPWLICVMSNWLILVWIWIRCISVELTPNWVIRFGETRLLVSWCVCGEYDMAGSDEDRGRSRRLGVKDRGWSGISRVLDGLTIGRSSDAVCDPHHTHGGDEKRGFPSLASKEWQPFVSGLASKPLRRFLGLVLKIKVDGLVIWASKPSGTRFVGLRLKIDERMKTVWWHASTSSGLLHSEASWAMASQFCLKTGEGATMGGARGIIVEVTWKWNKRRSFR
jgi:hypothetical protein